MACATLKRTHEWDPMHSPSGRPLKRQRCTPTSLFSTSSQEQEQTPSPFAEVTPKVTTEQIANTLKEEIKHLQRRKQLSFSTSVENSSPRSSASSSSSRSNNEQPLFTFRQVIVLCERLMKEREQKLREEYDQVLATKLGEQYDSFVKFTHDQIQKKFEGIPSYLS